MDWKVSRIDFLQQECLDRVALEVESKEYEYMECRPLSVAAMTGNERLVGKLLDQGAEIDAFGRYWYSTGNEASFESPQSTRRHFYTALSFASYDSCLSTLKVLLKRRANVNKAGIDGFGLQCVQPACRVHKLYDYF